MHRSLKAKWPPNGWRPVGAGITFVGFISLGLIFGSCSRPQKDHLSPERDGLSHNSVGQERPSDSDRIPNFASVRVQEVQKGSLDLSSLSTGILASRYQIPISAEINGTVTHKLHDLGDAVAAGDVIVQLDTEPCKLALQQADAHHSAAQVAYEQAAKDNERSKALFAHKDISQFELEKSELAEKSALAQLKIADAAVKLAERQLRLTGLCSPMGGSIAALDVQIGQQVAPGMRLGLVVALDQIELEASLTEREIGCVQVGAEARIRTENYPGRVFVGRVRSVGVAGLEPGNVFPVIIALDNSAGLLRPGMSVEAELIYSHRDEVFCIPRDVLVMADPDHPALFVVQDSSAGGVGPLAQRRQVRLGSGDANRIIVEDGLVAGDLLVIEGQNTLHDSARVKIL